MQNTEDQQERPAVPEKPQSRHALDIKGAWSAATKQSVRLADIDLTDRSLCPRHKLSPACNAADFVVDGGKADLAGGHAVVLQRVGERHRVVNGHRRLAALKDRPDVTHIEAMVLPDVTDELAAILPGYLNLHHGEPLSLAERRECFEREWRARKRVGGGPPSDREYARVYHVSPTSIGKWRAALEKPKSPRKSSSTSVQSGHLDVTTPIDTSASPSVTTGLAKPDPPDRNDYLADLDVDLELTNLEKSARRLGLNSSVELSEEQQGRLGTVIQALQALLPASRSDQGEAA